jgi:hypothetical protein
LVPSAAPKVAAGTRNAMEKLQMMLSHSNRWFINELANKPIKKTSFSEIDQKTGDKYDPSSSFASFKKKIK